MPASADNIDVSPSLKISQCVFVLSMLDENNWAFKKGTKMARNSKRLTMHSWIQVEIFRGNRNQHISPIHSWLLETTISQDAEPSAPEHEGYRSCWKSASFENLRDKVLLVTDVCITVIEFEKIHVIGNWWNHLDIFHWYSILYRILSVWKQWWHPCLSSLNWACQLKHWNWYTQFTSPASNPMQPINKY